jgi:hypothetical protein
MHAWLEIAHDHGSGPGGKVGSAAKREIGGGYPQRVITSSDALFMVLFTESPKYLGTGLVNFLPPSSSSIRTALIDSE